MMFTRTGLPCSRVMKGMGTRLSERRRLSQPGDELAVGDQADLGLGQGVVDEVEARLAAGLVVEVGPGGVRRGVELRVDVGVGAHREGRAVAGEALVEA